MEKLRSDIVIAIRSCLISTKGVVTLQQLDGDYRTIMGEGIPYKKLGYKNLEDFIKSEPTLVLYDRNGKLYIDAKSNEKTNHISDMVKRQKSSKKRTIQVVKTKPLLNINRKLKVPTHKWRPKSLNPNTINKTINDNLKATATATTTTTTTTTITKTTPTPTTSSSSITNNINDNNRDQLINRPVLKKIQPKHEQLNEEKSINLETIEYNNSSVLLNTKKRLSNLMSSLELDGDNEPINSTLVERGEEQSTKKVDDFQKTDNVINDLNNFVKLYKLGDITKTFHAMPKKEMKSDIYFCKIKIKDDTFSSYPNEFFDKSLSEQYASMKALDELIKKYSRRKSLLISSNNDILQRIPPMLEKHINYIWANRVANEYLNIYNEQLPLDWLQIIDTSNNVSIEKYLGGFVLKYCKSGEVEFQKGTLLTNQLNILSLNSISIPCRVIEFNINKQMNVMITTILSTKEIWCQEINTELYELFVKMQNDIEIYYKKMKYQLKLNNKQINIGNCYIANYNNSWIRIRVLDNNNDIINCFCVDYGVEYDISIDNIYQLKREFATIEAQAFSCSLEGLDDLYEISLNSKILDNYVGLDAILIITTEIDNGNDVLPVVLYDATTTTNDVINEKLIRELTIESATPHLDENKVIEVFITNVESNGDVFINIKTIGFNHLNDLLNNLNKTIEENDSNINDLKEKQLTRELCNKRLFLKKSKLINNNRNNNNNINNNNNNNRDDKWLRIEIIDWSPHGELAQIYYIDYGNTEIINLNNIILLPLDKLNDIINQYPAQAIKVHMLIEQLPNDFIKMINNLLPKDQSVLMKIVKLNYDNIPLVEFFKHSQEFGLFCINKTISIEVELMKETNNKLTKVEDDKKRKLKLVPSGGRLKKPQLPNNNEFFHIKVPFAVNPWNFFVQPLSSIKELNTLMVKMQERYNKIEQFSIITLDTVLPGNIYASKHDDNNWYRTSVLKVINSTSISVFFCDFGYYTNLTLRQLIPLDSDFMTLPYQALKARLSGIKPLNDKWTVEDCETFKKLVLTKNLISLIHDIDKDELHKSDIVLKLSLIDTTTEDDINIGELLIDKGIAKLNN